MHRRRLIDGPPQERLPDHVRDAMAAAARHRAGGPPLAPEHVQALIELSAWTFNGVPPDDPRFETRLAEWSEQAEARARADGAGDPPGSDAAG